jgi:hypothetical protein
MKNRKSFAPTVVIILVFLLALGGIWASMPMKFIWHLHTGTPKDSIFTLIDPDKMEVSDNELHFQWGIAEIKARSAVLGSILLLYLLIIYFYTKYRKTANHSFESDG